jgi:hypothetical protein
MKKLLLILLVFSSLFADSQVLQKINTYGVQYKRIQADSTLTLPGDTSSASPVGSISFKVDKAYIKRSDGFWYESSGGFTYSASSLGVKADGTDQTAKLNTLAALSSTKEIVFDNGDVTVNGALNGSGKVLSFKNGARILGTGTITNSIVRADDQVQVFGPSITTTGGLANKRVSIMWWGAKSDAIYLGAATNNRTMLQKAINSMDATGVKGQVYMPGFADNSILGKYYYFDSTVVIPNTIELYGDGMEKTILMFDGDRTGLKLTAPKCYLHDIAVRGAYGTESNQFKVDSAVGILINSNSCHLDHVAANQFDGDGIQVAGDVNTGSNANLNRLTNIDVKANGRYGLSFFGGDANACYAENINASGNAIWNIYDGSFLGNTFVNCHTASGGLDHSKNKTWVTYGGLVYGALAESGPSTSAGVVEPTVTANWQNYWVQVAYSLPFSQVWNNTTHYYDGGGYKTDGANQQSVFVSCYAEQDQILKNVIGPAMFIGGYAGLYGAGKNSFGSRGGWMTSERLLAFDATAGNYVGAFMRADAQVGGAHIGFYNELSGSFYSMFKYDKSTLTISPNANFSASPLFTWYMPGYATPGNFGRSAMPATNLGAWSWYEGFFFRRLSDGQNRMFRALSAAPTTGAHAAGDFVLNNADNAWTAGPLGWGCTVSGTPGTWVSIPIPGAGGGGSTTLAGLTDVNLTSPSNRQFLLYDNATSKWINGGLTAADIPDISATYIKNQTSQQASSNFNISGSGTIGGNMNVSTNLNVTGTSVLTGATTFGNTGNAARWWLTPGSTTTFGGDGSTVVAFRPSSNSGATTGKIAFQYFNGTAWGDAISYTNTTASALANLSVPVDMTFGALTGSGNALFYGTLTGKIQRSTVDPANVVQTASNVAATVNTSNYAGLFKQKSSADLQFKSLSAPSIGGITITGNTNEVEIKNSAYDWYSKVTLGTTDASAHAAVYANPLPNDCAGIITVEVSGIDVSGNVFTSIRSISFKKVSGACTLGTEVVLKANETLGSFGTPTFSWSVSANHPLLSVTAPSTTGVSWNFVYKIQYITPLS